MNSEEESGFGEQTEATLLFRTHQGTSYCEMPWIESDLRLLGWVDFNLFYCFEIPARGCGSFFCRGGVR